jgi:chromosomal replication initiation ATPase DnaA
MADNKDIEVLLKNIQEGLKIYSIKELNEAIIEALNKNNNKREDIDFVLEKVAESYEVTVRNLKKSKARGLMQDAKQTAYNLLHLDLKLTIRQISGKIFFNNSSSVFQGIKRLRGINVKLKQDKEFFEKYQYIQNQLNEYLTQKIIK